MRRAPPPLRCSAAVLSLAAALALAAAAALAQAPAATAPSPARLVTGPEPAPPIRGRVDPATYRVGPGDEFMLRTSATSEPAWLRVGPAGTLTLPRAGSIAAAGLTIEQLEARIRERLRPGAPRDVELALHRPRQFRMLVVGEVIAPGAVTLQAPARASEAIAAAGGVNPTGARRGIRVLHEGDTLIVDLVRMERTGDTANDPLVFENDMIQVPARGAFIELFGAAFHPGRLAFVPGDRLSDLVALSGGALPQAALGHAELTRVNERGLPERRPVALEGALRAPGGAEDLALAEGDRLYIPSRARWRQGPQVEIVGEVVRPGPYPIVEGEDRVRSLLERAGGLTEMADAQAIRIERLIGGAAGDSVLLTLVRALDPIVTTADREIALLKARERQAVSADVGALIERGDESGNALLLDQDRIVVPRYRPVVSVQGEVRSPGYVRWREGRSLWDYVQDAGGLTKRANRSHARVTVATTGQQVDPSDVPVIRAGDAIWIPGRRERSAWETTRDLLAAVAQASTFYLVIRQATK